VVVAVAAVGASWAGREWCIRKKIEAGPDGRDWEGSMSNRCIHKDDKGEQCPLMVETGLFCETHSVEGSKAKARRGGGGGGGGGGGLGGKFGESLIRRIGVVYHHEPPDKKKDYLG
jgi:hypothetical protein